MALGVVKQICTPSSAARPPVNHPKGPLPPLSTRFLISPPFISSLFFLFFLYIYIYISFTPRPFFSLSLFKVFVFARLSRVYYKARLAFPSSKRNGIWGRLRFVHAREPAKIEGGHAFFTRRACHRSIRHERRRWPTRKKHLSLRRFVRPFERRIVVRIVYFNLVPLTRGIKESRTTFTLLVYTPRGETSRSLTL